MKEKTRILTVLCLLAVASVWLLWPQHRQNGPARNGGGASATAPARQAPSASAMAVTPSHPRFPTLNTNKLAYRLSNTTNSLSQLEAMPHVILLENAFIDTEKRLNLGIPPNLQSSGDPGAYIVQARGMIDAQFYSLLRVEGARDISYIPKNACLASLSASAAALLRSSPLVQAVLPYEPYYKIQSSLLGLAVNQQPLPPGTALRLGLFGADAAAGEARLQALGARIIARDQSPFGPVLNVLAPADWTALAQLPQIQIIEPAHIRRPANDLSRVTLGISTNTTSPVSSEYSVNGIVLTGSNVLIAVNDSGVDTNHPDFSAGRVTGLSALDVTDTNGHGTSVAGVIAGNGSKSLSPVNVGSFAEGSVSNADFRGKAPLARLFSLNYGNYSDYQLQTNAALVGAGICNNSWDYGNGDSDYDIAAASYDFATRDAMPGSSGSQPVLFVIAGGNSGNGDDDGQGGVGDTILSPGTAKNVVTVGALEQLRFITNIVSTIIPATGTNAASTNNVEYWYKQTDSSNQVAYYSSRGNVGIGTESPNGRFKPDLVAPGTFVVSTSSGFPGSEEWNTNAYYNPSNYLTTVYTYQVAATNALVYYNVPVPPNATAVSITVSPNAQSPTPFPGLVIYCEQTNYPDPVNAPGSIDITSYNNAVNIPPGGGNCTMANILGNGFDVAVGVTNNVTVNYNLTVSILVTNDVGNLYAVLEGMNDSLGGYYRYDSGTSMAAAAVSGMLALIQDYFTNQLQTIPSPALMKAVLINGCRSVANYGLAFTNTINFEGWGLENIQNSVPATGLFNQADGSTTGSSFFVDQSVTNALATGDSHTYTVTINTGDYGDYLPFQATLVWTDPPGNPAAAIKLVNNLDLIVTNLDTGDVYYGNDISPNVGYNLPLATNASPNIDMVNNVQNVLLPPLLAGSYSVTVVGRSVNVNAVTAQTNNYLGQYAPNIVQDYALVVSVGEGEIPDAIQSIKDDGVLSSPTSDQNVTTVMTTNAPLLNQLVGANSPLMPLNSMPLGNNTIWGPSGVLAIGQTNQWHFYVVANNGPALDFTNAAFVTFGVNTLSVPRMGVYEENDPANATKPEGDIDMFVSQDATLTNLNPVAISNCLAAAGTSRAALANGGTQVVYYTNSSPGQVYYVGVQSQDQMGAEYDFLPLFTDIPFNNLDQNGNEVVNGLLLPVPIPPGNNSSPGVTNVFALAIMPMTIDNVIVTNWDQHQNFGDLYGLLTLSGNANKVVLNSHDGFGNTFPTYPNGHPLVYNDIPAADRPKGQTNSDGPGTLTGFQGATMPGVWVLSVLANSAGGFTGQVSTLTLLIQPHRNLNQPGIVVDVPPLGWFLDYVDVPPGYTNLTIFATNNPPIAVPNLELFERYGSDPTLTAYDQEANLSNGSPPGNSISVGPPLAAGRYFIGIYNPSPTDATNVYLSISLGINSGANNVFSFTSGSSELLPSDAVTPAPSQGPIATPGATVIVPNSITNLVTSVNVGMVVQSSQISDYTFTLVSPSGQRVLLMENRGGASTNGAGAVFVYTNELNMTATGGAAAETNSLPVSPNGSFVPIIWNFYTVPDQMTVYAGTNPATFNPNDPLYCLYNTGLTNNPQIPGTGGAQNTYPVTYPVTVPPGISNITIIMNQLGNPDAVNGDAWIYTAGAPNTNYEYLVFTDNTNLADVPIKFAPTPFSFTELSSNYTLSDLNLATNGDYHGPALIPDPYGGWTVPVSATNIATVATTNGQFVLVTNVLMLTNNLVSVVADRNTALLGDSASSNYLALAYGTITRSIPTVPGRIYSVTFWYRGPNIVGWWRGEGNGNDSSDPENDNNNGSLIGRFNFPQGEVSQAFGFQDQGNTYQFAGTNTYVQVPAAPSLNVGAGGGFTIEGWINPTNLSRPQPLVEWLARVPTNTATADTNLAIVQGPVPDPATGNYYYLLAPTNQQTSERWAEELGGHLVTLTTANLENWIYDTFTAYGTLNRDLWIGLEYTNNSNFAWTSGYTNLPFATWAPTQPATCGPGEVYVAILGPTNAYPGLWQLEDNAGRTCGNPPANPIYGVVEVSAIPTNGVQFWLSGTNWTGPLNDLQGSLCANIVDTNYVSHWIFSAPGLVTSNVYQHVALTFNTNSGIASLYLNGTNVASSNLYSSGVSFAPKTDGDLLLGFDMSFYTNNYYGGGMDEMSLYARALSDAEIEGIYYVSASSTNRLIGKFDPTVTPAVGLAEALVAFGTSTNIIYGVNDQWKMNSFTFTANSNSMPLSISGLEPGVLLDDFVVSEAPQTNLYYLPEQSLDALVGDPAAGVWTMQVWDNRVGAFLTNVDQLVNWQLSFVLQSNALISASLPPETPFSSTVPPGQTVYYSVSAPVWANFATNILVSSSQPVTLLFNATNVPNGNANDQVLLANSIAGVSAPPIAVNLPGPPYAPNQAGQIYYLGVQNSTAFAAEVVLQVNYDIMSLTNGVPYSDVLTNTYSAERYFAFTVSSNACEATFQLLKLSGNADLVVSKGSPLPTLNSDNFGSFNNGTVDQDIYVLTNSTPTPLSPGLWYLGVINRTAGPVAYSVLAKELDVTNLDLPTSTVPAIINLTNNVPFAWTAGPGAALTNFFRFSVTNAIASGATVASGLRFELFNLTGSAGLTLQTNALPLAPPFFQTSQNPSGGPQLIFVFTNNVLTNLDADWYLGVPSEEITNVNYSIVAQILTNGYFPAFPGAQGSGGGAVGGRGGDVYHVTTNLDSGPGTLRDAIGSATTNRTVVFDIGGQINLLSPLTITNSDLTIAGESSPGGGITVAGSLTLVTNAHDVIIRDVRFRSIPLQFNMVSNLVVDHVSLSWSTNANLAILASTNVTVQWSVIADSLYATNEQGVGSMLRVGGGALSFHHNLYADNYTGNPQIGDNLTLDFVNNVIFNWGAMSGFSDGSADLNSTSPSGCTNQLNYVANYLIAGADTTNGFPNIAFYGGATNAQFATWIFQTNNFIDSDTNGVLNGSDTGLGMFANDFTTFSQAFPTPDVSVDEAYQAYEKVLDFAGVNMALRDPADTNIVTHVRQQTGRIISLAPATPSLASSLPYLDTDQDGLPDFWEYTFTPNLVFVPSNNNDRDGDGYTDLEEYNNWLAAPHALTVTNTPVGVDLYQMFGESGRLAFCVTNGIQGSVYLTNVLGSVTNASAGWSNTIAIFTPATNYSGYASFDVYVTNLDTAAYFGPVTVSVIASAVPIAINSNMPPVITWLTSGVSSDPTNYGGSDFYGIHVPTNTFGALFEVDNPTGPMAIVVSQGVLPSLSSYDYYTNAPPPTNALEIAVVTNSAPVPLSPGDWFMAAVNESGSNVIYTAKITLLGNLVPPVFLYPTNTTVLGTFETAPLTVSCIATDLDTPPLPLIFSLASGPPGGGLTVSNNGVINWTPSAAQAPSTNTVAVSVSNGAFAVTNTFTIIVEESNIPPVLPDLPVQYVIAPNTLVITNTATNLCGAPLTYLLTSDVPGLNQPAIDNNGIITWTPTSAQAGSYSFTTVVTNYDPAAVNAVSLAATNYINVIVEGSLVPGQPLTNVLAPGGLIWFAVSVPTNAVAATNTLIFATLPVDLFYDTNNTGYAASELLANATNGVSVLTTNVATAPINLVPGGLYYLGVFNPNAVAVTNALRVDFNLAFPPPGLSLPVIANQIVPAGQTLVVTNTASDTNASATLVYTLVKPPAGANITGNGIIYWPTTTNIAPTNVVITTIVNDITDGLSATNRFTVYVFPPLSPGSPETNIIAPGSINWYTVTVPPTADLASNILLFATAPVNLWFSASVPPATTGPADAELLTNLQHGVSVINTTSAPVLVPNSIYCLGVQNTNNFPVTNAVEVAFHLVSPPPLFIFSITRTNLNGVNGDLITWYAPTNEQFHLQWSPALLPQNWASFNGVISEIAALGATNSLIQAPLIGFFQYFDDGSQSGGFGPMRYYRLQLLNSPANTAPFFTNSPSLLYATSSIPFMVVMGAKDWDIPAQSLTYTVSSSLTGTNPLTINPGTGAIKWTPTVAQQGQVNFVTTTVTDNGVPPLSAVTTFEIVVAGPGAPNFSGIEMVTNGVALQWMAPANEQFNIRWTTNLAPAQWNVFPYTITSTNLNYIFVDTNQPPLWTKFYQLILLP